MADFDRVAMLYDFLKKAVFGKQLERASGHFLHEIPANSNILLIGGGTGEILSLFNSSHKVKYLELSGAMIKKAKCKNFKASVEFVQGDVLEWMSEDKFDYIITPFVLDCFNEKQLTVIYPKLSNALTSRGKWIQTDFYPKHRNHRFLITFMYAFFRWTAKLENKKLPDFDSFFKTHNFICCRKVLFYHSMVETKIYQKIE